MTAAAVHFKIFQARRQPSQGSSARRRALAVSSSSRRIRSVSFHFASFTLRPYHIRKPQPRGALAA